jgi:hypothetical protein
MGSDATMTKPNDHWNVLPHGTLTPIATTTC